MLVYNLSVHYDSFIRCFDLRAYNMIKEEKIHEGQVTSIDISRDDLYTLTCGKDSLCRVWDNRVGFGKVLYQLSHDDFRVNDIINLILII
jgi:WD40 repeat protein